MKASELRPGQFFEFEPTKERRLCAWHTDDGCCDFIALRPTNPHRRIESVSDRCSGSLEVTTNVPQSWDVVWFTHVRLVGSGILATSCRWFTFQWEQVMAISTLITPEKGAAPRSADYEWRDRVTDKWHFSVDQAPFGCANLDRCLRMHAGKWIWSDSYEWSLYKNFYEVIRTQDLLYRVACTFPGKIETYGHEGYKAVWHVCVTHRKTGVRISLGEHKGAASWWTQYYDLEMARSFAGEVFLDDLLDLITYLTSDTCAHPYDGLVAGNIA